MYRYFQKRAHYRWRISEDYDTPDSTPEQYNITSIVPAAMRPFWWIESHRVSAAASWLENWGGAKFRLRGAALL